MGTRISVAASLLLTGAVLTLGLGCQLLGEREQSHSGLSGDWQWVRSVGGFTGQELTPASEGYTERRTFAAGVTRTFRNGNFVDQRRYTIGTEEHREIIRYFSDTDDFYPDEYFSFTGPDTLILDDNCADCFTSWYVRVK